LLHQHADGGSEAATYGRLICEQTFLHRVRQEHQNEKETKVKSRVIERGPDWLAIDEQTGLLSGIPDTAGTVQVTVAATIEGVGRAEQEFTIRVAQ